MGGSLGEAHADSIVRVMQLAGRAGAPVVGFIESGAPAFRTGTQASRDTDGSSARASSSSPACPRSRSSPGSPPGSGSYSPALTDFVLMTQAARMFLTGPRVVREALGEDVTMEELGGPRVHDGNGVSQLVADSEAEATDMVRELLGVLPIDRRTFSPRRSPPGGRDPGAPVPAAEARRVYDVRDVVAAIVDAGRMLEISSRWARNMVTGLARIEGRRSGSSPTSRVGSAA